MDQAFGYANSSQGILNSTQTRFAISALTQPFTAMAVLQLAQQGLLGLDDSITKYVSNYPQGSKPITIRELLTHTSGAPAAANQPSGTPGEKFQYSILNYLLLGEIIAKVSGESYQTYIQQHILTPLGMTNTGFISSMTNVANGAMGYHKNLVGTVTPVTYQSQNLLSSDGLYSTVGDLLKWEQALYTSKLVNFSAIEQMFRPDPITVSTLKTFGYGFGKATTQCHGGLDLLPISSLRGCSRQPVATHPPIRSVLTRPRCDFGAAMPPQSIGLLHEHFDGFKLYPRLVGKFPSDDVKPLSESTLMMIAHFLRPQFTKSVNRVIHPP